MLSDSVTNEVALTTLSTLRPVNAPTRELGKMVLTTPKGKITDPAYVPV